MLAKLSSVRIIAGAPFGHVRAADARGDAEVGLLARGRVVHAVAGHRDDVVARLERLHEPELLFGRNAGEDGRAVGHGGKIRVGNVLHSRPVKTVSSGVPARPTCCAMTRAVTAWSPVIIFTRCFRPVRDDERAGEGEVFAVGQNHLQRQRIGMLVDGDGFARERGFVHLQAAQVKQAQEKSDDGVDEHDAENDGRIHSFFEKRRDTGGDEEDVHERLVELPPELQPRRCATALFGRQLVAVCIFQVFHRVTLRNRCGATASRAIFRVSSEIRS